MSREPSFTDLHQALTERYDLEELRTLCAQLGVPYDDLRGEGRPAKAREFILWLQRRGRLDDLVAALAADAPPQPAVDVAQPEAESSPGIQREYDAFELLVSPKTAAGYPVTITHAPAGDASSVCRLDPTDDDFQTALRRLAAAAGHDPRDVHRLGETGGLDEGFLIDFGRRLFDGLFADEIATVFRVSLGQARGQGRGLRVCLHLKPPELAILPWEYLYDPTEDFCLAISPETPLVRYAPMPHPIRPLTIRPPLRVLVVISHPTGVVPLDVEQEKEIIEQALQDPVSRGLVQLHVLERAVVAEISQAMRSFAPHVFHFIGHGAYRDERAYAILEHDDRRPRWVGERTFRELFLGLPDTRLALLNACQTATISSAQPLAGLAPRLLQRNLSAVVAMQYPIPDRAALIFSREFYRSVALGYPVDAAMSEARKGIYLEVGSAARDWGIPVLFLRAPDGRLFEVAEAEPAQTKGGPGAGDRSVSAGRDISGTVITGDIPGNVTIGGSGSRDK
jgi:hypothetical protein